MAHKPRMDRPVLHEGNVRGKKKLRKMEARRAANYRYRPPAGSKCGARYAWLFGLPNVVKAKDAQE